MTPEQYCYDKVAQPGSTLYFSVRRITPEKRAAVVAICAFYREIEDITLTYEDLNTAQIKLNWWRNEVIHIHEGKPSHPVALFAQSSFLKVGLNSLSLIEIIDGLEQNLASPSFAKFEDVVIHIIRTGGVRERLIADVLQANNPSSDELIYQITLIIELVNYIQNLHRYVRADLIFFSEDEMQQFHVKEAEFHEFVTTKNIRELLQFQIEKIDRAYKNIFDKITATEREQLASSLIRCKIARAILKTIKANNFNVLENFLDITPLRKWWISWRYGE